MDDTILADIRNVHCRHGHACDQNKLRNSWSRPHTLGRIGMRGERGVVSLEALDEALIGTSQAHKGGMQALHLPICYHNPDFHCSRLLL